MEPLSATARAARPRGFTLIELLVAISIAAIAVATVAISGWPDAGRGLRFEAERLAQLLALAREEAQVRGRPVRLVSDAGGYRFAQLDERRWVPVADDALLRPREWDAATTLRVLRPDGVALVEFGRDAVDPPFRVVLERDGASATIVANGLGAFAVRER